MSQVKKVLFVCTGNICRSPAGEGVLQALLVEKGLDRDVLVDSAGTDDYHIGERADPRMREAASDRGFHLGSRARQVETEDFYDFDLVVAMDRGHLERMSTLMGGRPENLFLFSDFLSDGPVDVPDPYYGGRRGFEEVLDLMEEGCPVLLDHLLEGG